MPARVRAVALRARYHFLRGTVLPQARAPRDPRRRRRGGAPAVIRPVVRGHRPPRRRLPGTAAPHPRRRRRDPGRRLPAPGARQAVTRHAQRRVDVSTPWGYRRRITVEVAATHACAKRKARDQIAGLPPSLLVSGGTCLCLAASPGSSWYSYDRSRGRDRRSRRCDRTARGCHRRGPRRSSCTGRRCTWRTWRTWLPGRRHRSASVVIAGVLWISRTSVFTASTAELGSGVAVRVQVPVGVRVGARCCPSHRDPARRSGQSGRRHETHERLLHSLTSSRIGRVCPLYPSNRPAKPPPPLKRGPTRRLSFATLTRPFSFATRAAMSVSIFESRTPAISFQIVSASTVVPSHPLPERPR
jgi:hypothetical protein